MDAIPLINAEKIDLLRPRLRELFYSFGIQTNEYQTQLLLEHLRLLFEMNEQLNLTRITSVEDALVKHLLDSALFAWMYSRSVSLPHNIRFIDIGTGGGFPGIPFSILLSEAQGVLVDSVSKKASAVNNFIKSLKLNTRLTTSDQRCEDIARSTGSTFNLVLARAVAPLPVLIEYASPLLVQGGYALFSKATPTDEELYNTTKVAQVCGMELVAFEHLVLPQAAGPRRLYLYKKISEASINLPRRNGVATKKPLC